MLDKGTTLTLRNIVLTTVAIGFLSILLAGVYSDPYLADEVFHYRLAKYVYEQKAIPAYDPLAHTNPLTGKNYYVNEPLWHTTLALFWTITGPSQASGQLFQALVYIGLVFVIFLLGKELYGLESGYYAALLAASAPMVILYSILFHVDIPLMLLCALCYLMVLRKRWLWVGVILGLAFVTKRNSYFIAPAVAFCVLYYSEGRPKEKLKNLLVFLIALSVTVSPDLYRRHSAFGLYGVVDDKQHEAVSASAGQDKQIPPPPVTHTETANLAQKAITNPENKQPLVGGMPDKYPPRLESRRLSKIYRRVMLTVQPRDKANYADPNKPFNEFIHPENILIPSVIPTYLGASMVIALIVAVIHVLLKGKWVDLADQKYMLLYVTIPSFLIAYFFCFLNNWGLRYTGPVLVFLFVLGGNAFSYLKEGWRNYLRYLLIVICIAQIIAASFYIHQHRKIPPGAREAYEYAKKHFRQDRWTLTCKGAFPLLTGKPMLWCSNAAPIELDYIFWDANEKQMKEIFGKFHISYLFVDKDRVYNDSDVRHLLGYPMSFIKKLSTFDSIKLIFDNQDVAIWEIMYD